MNTFSIKESFSFAWMRFKSRPWFFIALTVAMFVVMAIISNVFPTKNSNVVFAIINLVLGVFVDMGLVTLALAAQENVHTLTWKTLWAPKPFWRYLGAAILTAVIVGIGTVLLIIPGIIAALGLMFTKYLVVDRHMGPVDALKESWRITKGSKLSLLGFMCVLILLNIAGAIALGVGLLITIPVSMLAVAHVYRLIERAAHGVPAPTVSA